MRLPSPVPGSDEWVALRRSGLGATDAAVVTGRSPFASPFDKFAEMQGTTVPKIATDAMRWGMLLEPIVAVTWADDHERKVRANRYTYWLEPGVYSHYDYDLVPTKGQPVTEILEVKTASQYAARDWGEQETDQVPEAYAIQAQHEIMVRPGIVRCHLAVLIGGQKLQSYVIDRDDEMIEDLLRIERRFYADAIRGIPPDMDGSEAATEYLRGLNPRDTGEKIDLTDEVENLALAYLAASASEKAAGEEKATAANRLREAMGANALGVGRSVKVSYKNSKDREETDWRKVADQVRPLVDDDSYAEAVEHNTQTKAGNRPLIVTPLDAP